MNDLIGACGYFIYPLGFCSLLGVFIILDRRWALRPGRVIPVRVQNEIIVNDTLPAGEARSVAGRILLFHEQRHPDADQLKAFGKMEVLGMERGMFLLEVVISAAPLVGLLGIADQGPDHPEPAGLRYGEGQDVYVLRLQHLRDSCQAPWLVLREYG